MSEKKIPNYVKLREERVWIPLHGDTIRDAEPAGEYAPYQYRPDAELEALLAKGEGDPEKTLQLWRAKTRICKRYGVHLIAGPLQTLLQLPVRQVYIHVDAIYRIEADGSVTTKLL